MGLGVLSLPVLFWRGPAPIDSISALLTTSRVAERAVAKAKPVAVQEAACRHSYWSRLDVDRN